MGELLNILEERLQQRKLRREKEKKTAEDLSSGSGSIEEPSSESVEDRKPPSTGSTEECEEPSSDSEFADDHEQPSTGVAENAGQVIIKGGDTHLGVGTIQGNFHFSVLKDLKDEAIMVNSFVGQSEAKTSTKKSARFPSLHRYWRRRQRTREENRKLDESFSVIQTAIEREDEAEVNWEEVKHKLENIILLMNTDTGGQAEFLDLQASLVQGPSFNLLFRRLVDSLDQHFKIYYTHKDGKNTVEEDSTMTVEEVQFQALSSIACFGGGSRKEGDSTAAEAYKSKVMFVGTHLDKVSPEEFEEKDKRLREKIENTQFYDSGIIEYASADKKQVMLAVNNESGEKEEMEAIRKILVEVIERSFEQIEIPVAWLMLSLHIRNKGVRTMSLSECEKLAKVLKIGPEELKHALWFLHHHVGVLLYYQDIPELEDVVICDMQIVYDSASNLVKFTFESGKVDPAALSRFKKKAQFSMLDVVSAMQKQTSDLLPPKKLIALLKSRNVLAVISSKTGTPEADTLEARALTSKLEASMSTSKDDMFFMPSILPSAKLGQ